MKITLQLFLATFVFCAISYTQGNNQTTSEEKERIWLKKQESELMSYFHNLQRKKYDRHLAGYDIIKTHDIVDSTNNVYSLVISRNDSIMFRTGVGVEDSNEVSYILYSLIPNGRKQIIIEEYTGGAHCCSMYWILNLADTIRVLYHSDENETEIGSLGRIVDYDNNSYFEFTHYLNSFHYFDKLCGACSPGANAVFKYSKALGVFTLANREYPSVNLEDIEQKQLDVKLFLDSTKTFNEEDSETLLALTLDVLIHYVYAGQDSVGWSVL